LLETILLDYLSEELKVPVYMEVPETPPASYVVIQKTGSNRTNRIDTAMVAIQSIADSLYEAASLNESVKAAMDVFEDVNPEIFRTELNSDYNYTNEETKSRRYQAVYNITFKE